ncbi:hypothetical protein PRIPAC_84437 [Pristionchus pacificus]|nr:hypothetical protein PRIPAC_84437 [Pristionchus pacificus]
MDSSVLIIGGSVALVVIIVVLALIIILVIRKRRKPEIVIQVEESSQRKPSIAYTQTSFYSTSTRKADPFEVDRSSIQIDSRTPLGKGAFGSVFLGRLSRSNAPDWNGAVAVKMQSDESKDSNQQDFTREISTMKAIGYHERLANILACVTLSSPIVLVLEYCANGDLQSYMRKRLNYMLEHSNRHSVDPQFMITQRQQLAFASQIAQGLEFISQRGFVHRDIAARNILVDAFDTCKIGDFGLCREVGKAPEHYQSMSGRLPIRWMSPEAIESSFFSSASDVWSYGILLFEIITLGGYPYPRWRSQEVLKRLNAGERMRRPESCSDSMFTLMQHCWMQSPSMRPTFTHIRRFLGQEMNLSLGGSSYYAVVNGQAEYYLTASTVENY